MIFTGIRPGYGTQGKNSVANIAIFQKLLLFIMA